MWVQSLGQEDTLEEGMATCSSVLAWKVPCTYLNMTEWLSTWMHKYDTECPHKNVHFKHFFYNSEQLAITSISSNRRIDECTGTFVSESHSAMSNSLQSHGLYSPWNSPGQNTGVGSLSLLQGIFPT